MPGSESRDQIQTEEAWKYLEKRFSISGEDLEEFRIEKKSGDFWLVSEKGTPELEYETVGIRFLRDTGKYLKPTTYGLQILGEKISSAIVKVSQKELETLLEGDMIERTKDIDKGYVAIIFEGKVIGCGLYKDELVSSRISRGRAKELLNFL